MDPEKSASSHDYVKRINRAIDYVIANLDEPLKLEDVARVACFSAFHFHRVFRTVLGETLQQFVKRLRLQRALRLLSYERARSLTEVALACGFASSSDFSRSFRQRFGVPPSAFDVDTYREHQREEWLDATSDPAERHRLDRLPRGENPDQFVVQMRDLPPRHAAYIRVVDPFRPKVVAEAAKRLVSWAERGDVKCSQWLGYMWDDPEIVAHKDCRYDVAVVADAVESDGEVGVIDFPEMRVAEVELRGPIDLEMRILDWLYGTWLPTSGYIPTNQPCFEAWVGLPFAHGYEHFELCLQIPVETC